MCMQCVRADRREAEGRPARWQVLQQREAGVLYVDFRLDTSRLRSALRDVGLVAERASIAMLAAGGFLPVIDPAAPTAAQLARATDVTPYFDSGSFRIGSGA